MKRTADILFPFLIVLLFAPFILLPSWYQGYKTFTLDHGFIAAFIKFAILATLGESVGLRIKHGVYWKKGFGWMPRALVWGILGITIFIAFALFSAGTPAVLAAAGFQPDHDSFSGRLWLALSTSILINTIYAPLMMTVHKITDTHIQHTGGHLGTFFRKVRVVDILGHLDWRTQWSFIFCKTIPFFWIPAHTLTFLLPEHLRVVFAAILGIILGILLSIGNQRKK